MENNDSILYLKLKKILYNWLLSSTSHGFPNILKTKNVSIKFIWIFFSIVSSGLCAFMISQNVINYFKYEVVTKTRLVSQFSAIFPTVTICNMNFFTSEFSVNLSEKFDKEDIFYGQFSGSFQENFRKLAKKSHVYGDSVDKLIIDCFYEFAKCNRSQFIFFLHPIHGNCFQFNSKNDSNGHILKISYYKDRIGGLRLILNLTVPEALKYLNPNEGALIFIHNNTDYPMSIDPVTVSPKAETNIAISRTFYESKEKPFSDCDKNTNDPTYFKFKAYQLVHKYTNGYTKDLCFYQCIQENLFQSCGCVENYYPYFSESKFCVNKTEIDCLGIFYMKKSNLKNCFDICPLECKTMWFDKTVSFNKFSTSKFQEIFQRYNKSENVNLNMNGSFNEIAIVNIYYEKLSYLQINEYPTIELVDLLSSIGGIASLFLGISVLSLVEFFELIMLICVEIKTFKKTIEPKI